MDLTLDQGSVVAPRDELKVKPESFAEKLTVPPSKA